MNKDFDIYEVRKQIDAAQEGDSDTPEPDADDRVSFAVDAARLEGYLKGRAEGDARAGQIREEARRFLAWLDGAGQRTDVTYPSPRAAFQEVKQIANALRAAVEVPTS